MQTTALDDLKRQTRILEVLARYGIEAKPQGRGYMARCPFHEDDTPSLSVDAVKNVWHCFGCDAGGSVIDFVMRKESITFREATDKLLLAGGHLQRASDFAGPFASAKATADETEDRPSKSQGIDPKLIGDVVDHYHRTLSGPDSKGLDYLKGRSLSDPETLKTFRVGYVNGTLKKLLPASAVEPLQQIGILNEKGNEFFYGCVVVPVFLADGTLGEMYGRSVEGSRHLYLPGTHRGVLNAKAAEVFDELILTEAILDALSLYTIGVQNVIPCYGTGGFTADHAAALQKTRRVFLAFDNDEAGESGAKKLADRLTADGKECHRIHLPPLDGKVKDLNDYVRQLRGQGMTVEEIKAAIAELMKHAPRVGYTRPATGGKTGSLSLVEQTESGLVFRNCEALYHLRGLYDNNGSSLRVIMTARREDATHTDRLDLYTAKHRVSFAYRAGARLELPPPKIEEDLNRLIPMLETLLAETKGKGEAGPKRYELTDAERRDALALLRAPDLLEKVAADLETVGYVGEDRNKQLAYLIATSRKLGKPLSAIVRSQSGAGKSYLMECVAELMPPEEVQYFSRLTPQSLYYMGKDELVHKLLIVDERDGSEEAEYPIRTLQTRRKLTLAVPIKDPSSGKIQTKQIEILGPIAYMESTTSATINPENANRNFEIFLDESDEQTRKIYVAQQKAHTLEGWKGQRKKEDALRRHHNAQRLLRPVKVLIPYTGKLKFPVSWTRGRRDHDRLLCLIEAIAFLQQCQRPEQTGEEGPYIEATAADYAKAYDIARTAFAHALTDMPREARQLLSHIREMVKEWSERLGVDEKEYGFRRRDVREYAKQPDHLVKRAMRMLEELEYLHVRRSGRGGSFVYHLARHHAEKDPLEGLTTPEELRAALKSGLVHCSQERSDGESGTKVEQGACSTFSKG
ncbi:MAG: CHC2 zinc finger domain-containing protein [Planctomycetota bacterium]